VAGEITLFPKTVLCDVENLAGWSDQGALRGGVSGGGRDVFELEGDDVDGGSKLADAIEIFIGSIDLNVGDLTGGRITVGRKGVDPVSHSPRSKGEHTAELTAAEDADCRAG
jgi:hypothetical protein